MLSATCTVICLIEAPGDSKVKSDTMEYKLRFWAFQCWFQIENRSIIKEDMPILVTHTQYWVPQTMGAPLLLLLKSWNYVRIGKGIASRCINIITWNCLQTKVHTFADRIQLTFFSSQIINRGRYSIFKKSMGI